MLNGDVLSLPVANGRVDRVHVGSVAAAIRPRVNGGLVVAVGRGFALLHTDTGEVVPLPEGRSDPSVGLNDGAGAPHGRLYSGATACARDGDGHLYVTTSAEGDEGNPAAGALYLADVGVGAPAIAPFAG